MAKTDAKTKKGMFTRTVDGFVNFMARLGYGADNQMSQGYYALGNFISRNRQELEAAYRGNWMVGAVVDTVADDMTKQPPEIVSSFTPEQTKKIDKEIGRLNIYDHLGDAIRWARLFGGAIAVMIIDGQDTKTPLKPETIRQGQFKGLQVLDRWLVNPPVGKLINEPGPDYGMPEYYEVIGDSTFLGNAKIHHSRVLRFDGIKLPYYQRQFDQYWGMSVVERAYDRLIMFDSISHGAAQLVFKAHLRTIGVQGLREALSIGGKAEEAVIKQFEYIRLMQSIEGLTLLDAQDQFQTHQYTFSGLPDTIMQAAQQVAGAFGIPMVRLFGMSPSGLNSTGDSDLRTYYDKVNKDQNTYLRPNLERKLYPVLSCSVFGRPLPEEFTLTFPSLWMMDDKEKVEIGKNVSAAVVELYNAAIISQKLALQELKQTSKITGIGTNITDDIIAEADDKVKESFEMMGFGKDTPFGKQNEDDDGQTADEFNEADHPRDKGGKFTTGSGESGGAEESKKSNVQRMAEAAMKNPELDIPNLEAQNSKEFVEKGKKFYYKNLFNKSVFSPALNANVKFDEAGIEHLLSRGDIDVQARRFKLLPKALGVITHAKYIDPEDIRPTEGGNTYGLVGRFKDGSVVLVSVEEVYKEGHRFLTIYEIKDLRGDRLKRKLGAYTSDIRPISSGPASEGQSAIDTYTIPQILQFVKEVA